LSQREKLLQSILDNPKNVRFVDACKAAELIGYEAKAQKGSHNAYVKSGELEGLNFQNRNGNIVPYQGKQLQRKIEEYFAERASAAAAAAAEKRERK
jgi:hypothetical protein